MELDKEKRLFVLDDRDHGAISSLTGGAPVPHAIPFENSAVVMGYAKSMLRQANQDLRSLEQVSRGSVFDVLNNAHEAQAHASHIIGTVALAEGFPPKK